MRIAHDELLRLVRYDPITGVFTRLVSVPNAKAGSPAGRSTKDGGIDVQVGGGRYRAHRLAWFYVKGVWPVEIDHRNGVRHDNRWSNLRDVSHAVNMQNMRRPMIDNGTGFLGVTRAGSGFRARCCVKGVNHQLGWFRTAEAAHAAYLEGKRRLHEGCTI